MKQKMRIFCQIKHVIKEVIDMVVKIFDFYLITAIFHDFLTHQYYKIFLKKESALISYIHINI